MTSFDPYWSLCATGNGEQCSECRRFVRGLVWKFWSAPTVCSKVVCEPCAEALEGTS